MDKIKLSPTMEIENSLIKEGYNIIAGVDEAGRGPLAGNVFAGAVILPEGSFIEGLNDSKKLTERKREELFSEICKKAVSYGIGIATVDEIESQNILNATFLAMRRAIAALSQTPDFVIVDGNQLIRELTVPCKAVVKGDSVSQSIAAASILAKVSRDRYMYEMAEKYPEYEFEKHKGYGTKRHSELIKMYGPSEIHRMSFLKNILK